MKSLIDAHLPPSLRGVFQAAEHGAIQLQRYRNGNMDIHVERQVWIANSTLPFLAARRFFGDLGSFTVAISVDELNGLES